MLGSEVTLKGWEWTLCWTKCVARDFCILHFSLTNWGVHASPMGNDFPTSFSKTIILHLDTLLKSFNYHYFALSLWSHCDPLFRVFRFSAFHLLSGGRSWDFLWDLGSTTSWTQTSAWNQQAFQGWFGASAGLHFYWQLNDTHPLPHCTLAFPGLQTLQHQHCPGIWVCLHDALFPKSFAKPILSNDSC